MYVEIRRSDKHNDALIRFQAKHQLVSKRTVVLGATTNPARYAYMAVKSLQRHGHEVIPVGIKKGQVSGLEIHDLRERPHFDDVDTVTLYVGPQNQPEWYDYILSLHPKRVIFNPGTENIELIKKLRASNIEPVTACTLVMLSIGDF